MSTDQSGSEPPQHPSAQPPPGYQPPFYASHQHRRLMRAHDDKMVAGVCGGLALYLGVDPTLVRVGAVVALVVGLPATVIAYVVAWVIMPRSI